MLNMKTENRIIVNKVRAFCEKRGIDWQEFRAKVFTDPIGRRLSNDTLARVWNGETNITLTNAKIIQRALGAKSLDELFE